MNAAHHPEATRAMRASVIVGVLMLIGKVAAWILTDSAAILSDAAESVVHVFAVGFAAVALRLSVRQADERYHYGYERITFFSAGFEGGMIMLAAIVIIWEAVQRWIAGLSPTSLPLGTAIVAAASVVNLLLGWYLVSLGRRIGSLILEANGKHVLTDSWTSFGVVAGLLLVIFTGWAPFDPLLAILVAANILWTGFGLVKRSYRGLMDYTDPKLVKAIHEKLGEICRGFDIEYHELRTRHTGSRVRIEVHLIFPYQIYLGRAHAIATMVEEQLEHSLEMPCSIVTHLEAREDHDRVHKATF